MIKVGQRLREERVKKGLSLTDAEKATKIKSIFLSAIEKGEYQKLPSSAYAYGFVRNYADFLELPKAEILALFRREFDEEKVFKVLPEGLANSDFAINKLKFKPIVFFVGLIIVILFGYVLFQYRFAILNPDVQIYSPKNVKINSKEVTVSGKTDPNATVYINNISVSLDEEGFFKKSMDLFPGKTVITIKVVNRFGRQTIVEKRVEVSSS